MIKECLKYKYNKNNVNWKTITAKNGELFKIGLINKDNCNNGQSKLYFVSDESGKDFAVFKLIVLQNTIWIDYANFENNYQKQGLMIAGLKVILQDIFEHNIFDYNRGNKNLDTNITSVEMHINTNNIASILVAQKSGFSYDAKNMHAYLHKEKYRLTNNNNTEQENIKE